jgi:outer membrane immunogenic protein
MTRLLISAAALALTAATALAADIPLIEPVVAPELAPVPVGYDWTGLYLGGFGGYAFDGEADFDFDLFDTSSTTDLEGFFGGGTLGANWQWNWLVLGVEGDIGWSDIDGSDPCPNLAFDCEVDIEWLASARGRVGLAWNNFLLFGTGGAAFAGVEADTPPFTPGDDFDETYFGWTAGGGVEIGVWQNWSIKGEYAYYDLGDETSEAGELDFGETDLEIDLHTVKFGVNYRF